MYLLTAALIVASCAGDDSDGDEPASTNQQSPDARTVAADDFRFAPEQTTLTAGVEVSITLRNHGSEPHTWTVLSEEIATEADFSEDLVLAEVAETAPGAATETRITIDEAGTYQMICTVPDHFDRGMFGSVIVQ